MPKNTGIIENLSQFEVSGLIRKTLNEVESVAKGGENNGFFERLKAKIPETDWDSKVKIEELFSEIADFEPLKLDGNKRDSLKAGLRFVEYWSNRYVADNDAVARGILRTGLLEVVDLFHAVANASDDRKEGFFAGLPSMELHCIGGSNSRNKDMIRSLNADGLNKVVMEAYFVAKAQMVERLRVFEMPGNHEHVGRYFEYLLSLKTEKELLGLDNNAFLSAKNSPALVVFKVMEDFLEVFKEKLVEGLRGFVKDEVGSACKEVIDEVNKDVAVEGSQVASFAVPIAESQFLATSDNLNLKYSVIVAKLGERLKLGDVFKYFDETLEGDEDFSSQDSSRGKVCYKINKGAIAEYLFSRSLDEIFAKSSSGVSVAGVVAEAVAEAVEARPAKRARMDREVAAGPAEEEAVDVGAAAMAVEGEGGAGPAADEFAGVSLAARAYSAKFIDELKEMLRSKRKEDNASAVDILFVLSNPSLGFAPIHFVRLMQDPVIIGALNGLLLDESLPINYREKISSSAKAVEAKRDGILQKFEKYQPALAPIEANDFAMAMFGSTEDSARTLNEILASGDVYSYHAVGINFCGHRVEKIKDLMKNLFCRGDLAMIVRNIDNDSVRAEILDFACDMNDLGAMTTLLDEGVKAYGKTLCRAIGALSLPQVNEKNKKLEVVKFLINHPRVDLNSPGDFGKTPLHIAASHDGKICREIVKALLDSRRADPNKLDDDGNTALHHAALRIYMGAIGYVRVEPIEEDVMALLKAGCNAKVVNAVGRTALDNIENRGVIGVGDNDAKNRIVEALKKAMGMVEERPPSAASAETLSPPAAGPAPAAEAPGGLPVLQRRRAGHRE